MIIKELKIEHFMGFFEEQAIYFAVPRKDKNGNGIPGSGLTVITGQNNTGKTAIFESLQKLNNVKDKVFDETERHGDGVSPKISLAFNREDGDGDKISSITNSNNGCNIQHLTTETDDIPLDIIQSRRYWEANFGNSTLTYGNFRNSTKGNKMRGTELVPLATLLNGIEKDPVAKKNMNDILKKVITNFYDWTTDARGGSMYIKYQTTDSVNHSASMLGDGVSSIFRIAAHLTGGAVSKDVLIIDEPELSLHPNAQRELSKIISEYSSHKQIVIATHSPYFVNWEDFLRGAHFVRLNKHDKKRCQIYHLQPWDKLNHMLLTGVESWQKPEFLDLVSRELFFSNKILFVEGKEDVGLIKKWFRDKGMVPNFDIFAYGAGGSSQISIFLQIARLIGIEKVAAIYDGDTSTRSIYTTDSAEFTEASFSLICLDKHDIREKKDICDVCEKKGDSTQRFICGSCGKKYGKFGDGYFDQSGNIKTTDIEDEKGQPKKSSDTEFGEIMTSILDFFKDAPESIPA